MCVGGGGEAGNEARLNPGPLPSFLHMQQMDKHYGDKARHKDLAFIHVEGSGHKINLQFVFLSQLASAGLSVTNLSSDNNFSSFIHNLV